MSPLLEYKERKRTYVFVFAIKPEPHKHFDDLLLTKQFIDRKLTGVNKVKEVWKAVSHCFSE